MKRSESIRAIFNFEIFVVGLHEKQVVLSPHMIVRRKVRAAQSISLPNGKVLMIIRNGKCHRKQTVRQLADKGENAR